MPWGKYKEEKLGSSHLEYRFMRWWVTGLLGSQSCSCFDPTSSVLYWFGEAKRGSYWTQCCMGLLFNIIALALGPEYQDPVRWVRWVNNTLVRSGIRYNCRQGWIFVKSRLIWKASAFFTYQVYRHTSTCVFPSVWDIVVWLGFFGVLL